MMRGLFFCVLLAVVSIAFPPYRASSQNNSDSSRSTKQKLSENIKVIHEMDAVHSVDSALIAIRKNRADSLQRIIDSVKAVRP